jgi:hypothetical protein
MALWWSGAQRERSRRGEDGMMSPFLEVVEHGEVTVELMMVGTGASGDEQEDGEELR